MVIMLIFVKQGCDDVTNTAQLKDGMGLSNDIDFFHQDIPL